MITSSELDQRVEVLARVSVKNALNEDVVSWPSSVPPHRRWAKAMESPGREFVKGTAESTQRLVAFKMRWTAAFDATARIAWQGVTYEIADITGTRQSGEMWVHCKSVRNGA